jgi:hypothetical protein
MLLSPAHCTEHRAAAHPLPILQPLKVNDTCKSVRSATRHGSQSRAAEFIDTLGRTRSIANAAVTACDNTNNGTMPTTCAKCFFDVRCAASKNARVISIEQHPQVTPAYQHRTLTLQSTERHMHQVTDTICHTDWTENSENQPIKPAHVHSVCVRVVISLFAA